MSSSRESNSYDKNDINIAIITIGWPMVTVARDGVGDFKEDKCSGVNGLGNVSKKP